MSKEQRAFNVAAVAAVSLLALANCNGWGCGNEASTAQSQQPTGREVYARVTAYCPCEKCCGKFADGQTSRGRDAWTTRGVAVDPKVIPYGSTVHIPGAGSFEADDTGAAMRKPGRPRIDLRFHDHQAALEWGVKNVVVLVQEPQ